MKTETRLLPLAARAVVAHLLLALSIGNLPVAAWPYVGLSSVRARLFENENLIFYTPEAGDRFGEAIAVGDFNGDGADDLATGIPYDDGLASFPMLDSGSVVVRYGVAGTGLAGGLADTVLREPSSGGYPAAVDNRFGSALAAGDFDGDGYADLAVGSPGADQCTGCPGDFGRIDVFYGQPGGLSGAPGNAFMEINLGAQPGYVVLGTDWFGSVLAAGDFNGDSYDDLAIGIPRDSIWDEVNGYRRCGSVMVVSGGLAGLVPLGSSSFHISEFEAQIGGTCEVDDFFGFSLAVGNFNGDTHSIGNNVYGYDDLAIGVPGEGGAGEVVVLYGSSFSLLFGGRVWLSDSGIGGATEVGDSFGYALAAADFDGDLADDLAIGSPFEDLGLANSIDSAGKVSVLYGQVDAGFDFSRTDFWSEENLFGPGNAGNGDFFGYALGTMHFDPHWDAVGQPVGFSSLAVGSPGRDLGGTDRGYFMILTGAASGVGATYRTFSPGFEGTPGTPTDGLLFGYAFATGDFDGNGYDDLATGMPFWDPAGIVDAGGEAVFYGSTFADGFDVGNLDYWSGATP